jgi:hypothetical protein
MAELRRAYATSDELWLPPQRIQLLGVTPAATKLGGVFLNILGDFD